MSVPHYVCWKVCEVSVAHKCAGKCVMSSLDRVRSSNAPCGSISDLTLCGAQAAAMLHVFLKSDLTLCGTQAAADATAYYKWAKEDPRVDALIPCESHRQD